MHLKHLLCLACLDWCWILVDRRLDSKPNLKFSTPSPKNRTRADKPTEPARWDAIRPLVQGLRIPVIANGDIYTREHLAAVRAAAGDPRLAVMLARPALYNPSVFRVLKDAEGGERQQQQQQLEPLEPLDGAMWAYVRLCLRFENHVSNSKYTLMEMLCRRRHPDHLKVRTYAGWSGVLWRRRMYYRFQVTNAQAFDITTHVGRPAPRGPAGQEHPRHQPAQDHRGHRRPVGA